MSDSIMIKIPALTEERRVELLKIAKKMGEEAKI
jgi:ribosome recycling factor